MLGAGAQAAGLIMHWLRVPVAALHVPGRWPQQLPAGCAGPPAGLCCLLLARMSCLLLVLPASAQPVRPRHLTSSPAPLQDAVGA